MVSSDEVGTDTILQAVPPRADALEGMKSEVWLGKARDNRAGVWTSAMEEKAWCWESRS